MTKSPSPAPPWWTDADAAELALLVRTFVDGAYDHREHCGVCSRGEVWCAGVPDAFETVMEWMEWRRARSFASAMRARQDIVDRQVAA